MNMEKGGNNETKDKEYPFQLIEFVKAKGGGKYDLVPKHWISFDTGTGKLVTKFLNPPYNDESCQLLHSLVESLADPPESWPKYEIILKGRAETYSEAVERVEMLNSKPYAYTTESDNPPAKRAESEVKKYQKEALRANKTLLQTVMEVPRLGKPTKKPIYDDVYTESERNSDAGQSSSSDGAEYTKKIQVRPTKKTSKSKGSVKRQPNSQKKKGKSIPPPKRAQVVESDGSDSADSSRIPIVARQGSAEPSTSNGSSTNQYKYFRPSYHTVNISDSALSPPPTNRAENPTDKRDAAVKNKNTEDVHLKRPSAKKSGKTNPSQNPTDQRDAAVINNGTKGLHLRYRVDDSEERSQPRNLSVIPERVQEPWNDVVSNNLLHDRQPHQQKVPKETLVILKAIKELAIDVQNCTSALERMQGMLERSKIVKDIAQDGRSFVEKYNLELPFDSEDEFKLFDQLLKDNAECRKDLAASLQFFVNPDNNPNRTVTTVLKKYMKRTLALKFTAVKDSQTKTAFKDMAFCSCLLDLVVQSHTDKDGAPVCEKTFYKVLGASLANAKDWDGHRLHRPRR